jgi:hypothetical protein
MDRVGEKLYLAVVTGKQKTLNRLVHDIAC